VTDHGTLDSDPRGDDALIARYLDGALTGEELRAFEGRLRAEPALREAVELDRRMVASLGATLGPGGLSTAGVSETSSQSGRRSPARSRRRRVGLAIAAGMAIVVSAAALWYQHVSTSQLPRMAGRTPVEIYTSEVGGGFTADWVCADDAEALRFTRERFGSGLLFAERPGVSVVGWGYAEGAISDRAAVLLATYQSKPLVAIVDRKSRDRRLADPTLSDPNLRMFRREVGAFVVYEITPLQEPVLAALAYAVGDDVQLGPGEKGQRAGVRPTGPKPPARDGK